MVAVRPLPVRQCMHATFSGSASSQFSTDVQILNSSPSGGAGCPGNLNCADPSTHQSIDQPTDRPDRYEKNEEILWLGVGETS